MPEVEEWQWRGAVFHRTEAAEQADFLDIEADTQAGTRDDALWQAIGSNREQDTSGLRSSNADKRRAVEMALRCRPNLSGRKIAEHIGVDHKTVDRVRTNLSGEISQIKTRTVTREVNGPTQTYTMQTAGIGRGQAAPRRPARGGHDHHDANGRQQCERPGPPFGGRAVILSMNSGWSLLLIPGL